MFNCAGWMVFFSRGLEEERRRFWYRVIRVFPAFCFGIWVDGDTSYCFLQGFSHARYHCASVFVVTVVIFISSIMAFIFSLSLSDDGNFIYAFGCFFMTVG